jgi:hypothetical protein
MLPGKPSFANADDKGIIILRSLARNCLFGATLMVVAFFFMTVAHADSTVISLKDVQTVIRAIGFLENTAADGSVIGIIYNPDNSNSTKSAHDIESLIMREGGSLHPRLVPVSDISQLQGVSYAFVTDGLEAYYDKLGAKIRSNKILSFTLDRSCLDHNCCAVYINSKDRVEIVVNKAAADAVEAHFKPVFLMMVTVI